MSQQNTRLEALATSLAALPGALVRPTEHAAKGYDLDVSLTPELQAEGTARDLVNRIQNIRKEKDFNVTDRVTVTVERHEAILAAVSQFHDYIKGEVLATDLVVVDGWEGDKVDLNDEVELGIAVSAN